MGNELCFWFIFKFFWDFDFGKWFDRKKNSANMKLGRIVSSENGTKVPSALYQWYEKQTKILALWKFSHTTTKHLYGRNWKKKIDRIENDQKHRFVWWLIMMPMSLPNRFSLERIDSDALYWRERLFKWSKIR